MTRQNSSESSEEAKKSLNSLLARDDVGFFRLSDKRSFWLKSQSRALEVSEKFDRLVVVGIGGSSLGAQAIANAMGYRLPGHKKVSFLSNVDGMEMLSFFEKLKEQKVIKKTHWLFVSKSGGTKETLTLLDFVEQWLCGEGESLAKFSTVISEDKKSPLVDWAYENQVPVVPMDLDIGGRFSVLTPVGMFPAAFLGLKMDCFLDGAQKALENRQVVEDLVAASLQSFSKQEWVTGFWIYCSFFATAGQWIQQLWAESLAKKENSKGEDGPQVSTPLPLIGSIDQHSVLQQMSEGKEKKFIWFFRVKEAESCGPALGQGRFSKYTGMANKEIGQMLGAFACSTQQSLKEQGVHSLMCELNDLSEGELGEFFMTMMLVVGAIGEALEINAFDQPGVELSKTLVSQYL